MGLDQVMASVAFPPGAWWAAHPLGDPGLHLQAAQAHSSTLDPTLSTEAASRQETGGPSLGGRDPRLQASRNQRAGKREGGRAAATRTGHTWELILGPSHGGRGAGMPLTRPAGLRLPPASCRCVCLGDCSAAAQVGANMSLSASNTEEEVLGSPRAGFLAPSCLPWARGSPARASLFLFPRCPAA